MRASQTGQKRMVATNNSPCSVTNLNILLSPACCPPLCHVLLSETGPSFRAKFEGCFAYTHESMMYYEMFMYISLL